jgi:hypothetical protein
MLARPDQKEPPAPCRHLHGAFRRRAGLDGRYVRDNVVVPFFCARHDRVIGLDLAPSFVRSGVVGRQLSCTAEARPRPRRGFERVTIFRQYRPAHSIEGPELTSDVLDGSVLERLLGDDDPDSIDQLVSLMLKTYCVYAGLEPLPHDALLRDAFARLAAWQLPGLARAGDTPVAAALRAALWIRRTAANRTSDFFAAFHPQGRVVERLQPLRRSIRRDDQDAARFVIHHAQRVLVGAIASKPRWRAATPASNYLADWSIIKAVLDDGLSIRDVAEQLGLHHAGIAKRFSEAIAAITDSLGQVQWSLNRQNGKFVRGVERHDKPAFRLGSVPPPLPVSGDETWLIDEARHYLGAIRVPPGCAADYPAEKPRARAKLVRWHPDDNEDEDGITRHEPGLWTEGRHTVTAQRAADWPAIAAALPPGPAARDVALEAEDLISRVLDDTSRHERDRNPYHPTSEPESRFATTSFNAGITLRPRSNDADDGYCGPAMWVNGKLVPRRYDTGRRVIDVADKLSAALGDGAVFTYTLLQDWR